MGDHSRISVRRRRAHWLCALGLLLLPACTLDRSGIVGPGPNLNQGSLPRDGAIFCDIERAETRHCATEAEKLTGISLSDAALALNEGRTSSIALDFSADALSRCGGEPEAVTFQGPFPEGFSVCLNCGEVIGPVYADANAACRAQCYDFFGSMSSDGTIFPENPPSDATIAFCDTHAKVSTNVPVNSCFANACSTEGTLRSDFVDPRRTPEPVIWTDFIGTDDGGVAGNDLSRTLATSGLLDAGAVSKQSFSRGNGYVEFSATQSSLATHVVGLTNIPAACPDPCPDTDPGFEDIDFAISLSLDGYVYLFESGALVTGPDVGGSFGTYSAGERFRISVVDKENGTAEVTYSRVVGACTPGSPCNLSTFHTSAPLASYPLRVDASFHLQGATISDVRLVRIQ